MLEGVSLGIQTAKGYLVLLDETPSGVQGWYMRTWDENVLDMCTLASFAS